MKSENEKWEIKFRWRTTFGWMSWELDQNFRDIYLLTPTNKKTVGMWTGQKDKNGTDIYEGDVLKLIFRDKYCDLEMEGVVKFCKDHLSFNCFDGTYQWGSPLGKWNVSEMEVIGNIYDDPELNNKYWEIYQQ